MPRLRKFLSALRPTRLGVLFAVLIGLAVGFWQWGPQGLSHPHSLHLKSEPLYNESELFARATPFAEGSVPITSTGMIPAPHGSTDCCPEVQKATATEFLLVSPAKHSNFIWGEIGSGGELALIVENLPKTTPYTGCSGKWLFQQMLAHFGPSVTVIQGNWIGPNSDICSSY